VGVVVRCGRRLLSEPAALRTSAVANLWTVHLTRAQNPRIPGKGSKKQRKIAIKNSNVQFLGEPDKAAGWVPG
jgi:hypothetical protein